MTFLLFISFDEFRPLDTMKLGVVLSHWGQNVLPVVAAILTFLQLGIFALGFEAGLEFWRLRLTARSRLDSWNCIRGIFGCSSLSQLFMLIRRFFFFIVLNRRLCDSSPLSEKISKLEIFSFFLFCSRFSHSIFTHSRFSHTPRNRL